MTDHYKRETKDPDEQGLSWEEEKKEEEGIDWFVVATLGRNMVTNSSNTILFSDTRSKIIRAGYTFSLGATKNWLNRT